MKETYCKKCNYIFQFYKRIHHPEYCTCESCMVDYFHTESNGRRLFRYVGDDFGHREVDE